MPTNKNKVTKATELKQIQEQEINEEVIIDVLNQICRSCTILNAFERKYGYSMLLCSIPATEYILFKRNVLTSYRLLEKTYGLLLKIERGEEF